MAYATQANIEERYGATFVAMSFDKDGDGNADAALVSKALDDATDIINSYVAAKYALPLSPVPTVLVGYCVDLAVYKGSAEAGSLTEEKTQRYKDAIAWLRDLAKGLVSLGIEDPPPSVNGSPRTTYPNTRLFTRDTMKGLM